MLQVGRLERRLRPGAQVVGVAQPLLVVAAQVPGGVDERVGRRGRGVGRELEQVAGRGRRHVVDRDAVRRRPALAGGRAPPAVEEPVGLGDVPGPRDRHPGIHEGRGRRLGRPPHPARGAVGLEAAGRLDDLRERAGVGTGRRGGARPTARRGPEA